MLDTIYTIILSYINMDGYEHPDRQEVEFFSS
jgi:hypothetical protein